MGLSAILAASTSGLRAIQTSTQWRSDNISNAQNPIYARRDSVTVETTSHFVTGSLARASDDSLRIQFLASNSQSGAATVYDDYFKRIGDILGTSESSPYLEKNIADFTAAWKSFESEPASAFTEREVVRAGADLGDRIRQTSSEFARIENELRTQVQTDITDLNTKIKDLDSLNKRIGAENNPDRQDPGLLDQRDKMVRDISELVGVTALQRTDNSVALYTKGGNILVDHDYVQFQWNNASGAQPWISLNGLMGVAPGLNSGFSGGKIGALLDLLNRSPIVTDGPEVGALSKMRAQLDSLADSLASDTQGFGGAYAGAQATRTTDLPGTPNPAAPAAAGAVMLSFFTRNIDSTSNLTPAQSIAVNASLLNGTASVKQLSATPVVAALTSQSRAINAVYTDAYFPANTGLTGMSVNNRTYEGLATAMSQTHADAQANAASDATRLETINKSLENRHNAVTGVNMDNEMAQLTVLQNAYGANARVITTVQAMFDTLMNMSR